MNAMELHPQLINFGLSTTKLYISDADYSKPKSSYLFGEFKTFYKAWLFEHNLHTWQPNWDCDNFSSTYYVFAQMCHAKSSKTFTQGIAVGELFYLKENSGGHAINIAITEKGVTIIEPQTGNEIKMTDAEKKSVWMIRF
jgi:hypothetical protein